jgi:hypothetical protein
MDIVIAIISALVLAQFIDGRVAFVLVGLIFAGRQVFLHKQRLAEIERLGLGGEDAKTVSEHIKSGDQDAAIKHVEEMQERQRTALSSMGLDVKEVIPEVGREIPWSDIVRHVFRVLEFDRSITAMDGEDNVKAANTYNAQQRATLAVNRELVLLYWQIGRDILARQAMQGWGAKVIDRLAHDLRIAFPEMKGFSPRNLKYMRAFAEAWPDSEFVQQPAAQLP